MHADHREQVKSATVGEIVALQGLKDTVTGDTLHAQGLDVAFEPIEFDEPVIRQTIEPNNLADRDKLDHAMDMLVREDPTLRVLVDQETGQSVIAGMGELHLEVARHRLERDFRVEVRAGRPLVAYRETVRGAASASAKLERPFGDGRQVVSVELAVQASSKAKPSISIEQDFAAELGGQLRQAISHEAQSLLLGGGEFGYPLAQLSISLKSVEYSPMTDEPSVEMLLGAASKALDFVLRDNTQLLEPLMGLKVEVPEEYSAGVLGDLSARGAIVENIEVVDGKRFVEASSPLDGLFSYSTKLRSMTKGHGVFSLTPRGYIEVSAQRFDEIIDGGA